MKASELRIGNLVYCWNPSTGTHNETVISINWKHIRNRVEQPEDTTYEPIPLTEEWLVKFGFKDVQRGFYSIKAGSTFFRLTPPQFMGEWQTEYCWVYDDFKFTEVKYVHQLQNLYFALTGEELTIK